jgi:phosphoglucosamine mutase
VLLRASGTERLIRVMVEAPTEKAALAAADRLASVVTTAFGSPPAG